MKAFSRSFTLKEKILLLLLSLVLIGLAYYQFVDQPVRSALVQAQAESHDGSPEQTDQKQVILYHRLHRYHIEPC